MPWNIYFIFLAGFGIALVILYRLFWLFLYIERIIPNRFIILVYILFRYLIVIINIILGYAAWIRCFPKAPIHL